ncbi:hypothetical protein CBER1_07753 [Cercospora berteroae]|uniref:Uncharacterized protein n=1 Tax=Cercospora berteroae TaxID=357750 RepID=A0A2S6C3U2_9PEZI|nr:hypothetical protein CBER1_07753 [Cercospora berteroae]
MLHGCSPFREIESSFEDMLKKDWGHPDQAELAGKLRAKHGDNFELFQTSMKDICEDLRNIMVLMGIIPVDSKLSVHQLDAIITQITHAPQNFATVQTRFRFLFKERAIKAAFNSLGVAIERLTSHLQNNATWQQHRRGEQKNYIFAAVQRRRAQLVALANTIEETMQSAKPSRTLEFALLLNEQSRSEDDALEAMRCFAALFDHIAWRRAVFHASDSVAAHQSMEQRTSTLVTMQDLWPLLQSPGNRFDCMELHLDLRGCKELTGFYQTPYGAHTGTSTAAIRMLPARSLLGQHISRGRRLHMAATIVSWMEMLYGTPLMPEAWDPDDIKYVNYSPANNLTHTDSLCLRTKFEKPSTSSSAAPNTSRGTALLMLGIVLIELWTNRLCAALQNSASRSPESLGKILDDMMAAEGPDLPLQYSRAVSDCWRLARTPDAFQAEFGGLVNSVVQTAAVFNSTHRIG